MITTGLADWTAGDLSYLQTSGAYGKLTYQLELQRYAPVWQEVEAEPALRVGSVSKTFDMCATSTHLVRAWLDTVDQKVYSQYAVPSGASTTWNDISTINMASDLAISLCADGSRVYLFSAASNYIFYRYTDDVTGAWSYGHLVQAGFTEAIEAVAAVSPTRVHAVIETAQGNHELRVYEYIDSAWVETASHIKWPLPFDPNSFDAITLDSGDDVIVMAVDLPPLLGKRLDGLQLAWESTRVQAIVSFIFDVGTGTASDDCWSDYYHYDVIDKTGLWTRLYPRLSKYDDMVFMTYYRGFGTDWDNNYVACARTKDGVNWEMPAPFKVGMQCPAKVEFFGDWVYLGAYNWLQAAERTAFFGTPASTECEDISSHVRQYSSRVVQTRETGVSLSNVDDVLRGAGKLLADRYAKQAVFKLGYWEGTSQRRGQIFVGDVVQVSRSRSTPTDGLDLKIDGRLNLLNRIMSEGAHEWPSQQIGGDNFWDSTETGYGGLKHWAPEAGRWTNSEDAEVFELYLGCDNDEGVGFSTIATDLFIGQASGSFQVNEDNKGEYAGICFWAHDKLHLWYAAYFADDDVIKLCRRTPDDDDEPVDVVKATSPVLGWSTGTEYFMKVILNYAEIKVFTSTDITANGWTERISYERAAIDDTVSDEGISMISGRVGYLGMGYNPNPEYTPTPIDPIPDPTPDPVDPWEGAPQAAIAWNEGEICWTENIMETDVVWSKMGSVGDGDFNGAIKDVKMVMTSDESCGLWVVTGVGVYYNDHALTGGTSFNGMLDQATYLGMSDPPGATFEGCAIDHSNPDFVIVGVSHGDRGGAALGWGCAAYTGAFAYSSDRGSGWAASSMPSDCDAHRTSRGYTSNTVTGLLGVGSDGVIQCFRYGGSSSAARKFVLSSDGGASFVHANDNYWGWQPGKIPPTTAVLIKPPIGEGYAYSINWTGSDNYPYTIVGGDAGTKILPTGYSVGSAVGGGSGVRGMTCDPYEPSKLWGTFSSGGQWHLLKSTDSGASWSVVKSNAGYGAPEVWPGNTQYLFNIVGTVGERSSNGGSTWASIAGDWVAKVGAWTGGYNRAIILLPRIGANE